MLNENYTPVEDFEGLAASFGGGLAEQSDLNHQINVADNCGKYWSGHFNAHGVWRAQPILCGHCDDCLQRKALKAEKRILRRIESRLEDNDNLVLSMRNVTKCDYDAFRKRLQRDETAQYYRAVNEAGSYDYIIQSEQVYGEVVETLDYDFALAAKIAKAKGTNQTGLLYSTKSKKVASDKPDTYSLNLTKVTAARPQDSKRITTIAKAIKPTEYAYDAESHQAQIFVLTNRLTDALNEANIPFRTEGILRQATNSDRLKFNANVVKCPNQTPIEKTNTIGSLLGQIGMFDDPEPEPELPFYRFETSIFEDMQRQIELCGYPTN